MQVSQLKKAIETAMGEYGVGEGAQIKLRPDNDGNMKLYAVETLREGGKVIVNECCLGEVKKSQTSTINGKI